MIVSRIERRIRERYSGVSFNRLFSLLGFAMKNKVDLEIRFSIKNGKYRRWTADVVDYWGTEEFDYDSGDKRVVTKTIPAGLLRK